MRKFYDRKQEIQTLSNIEENSKTTANFTVMTGRRRIGKTSLLKEFIKDKKSSYLFVSRNAENFLCEQWQLQLEQEIGLKIFGNVTRFSDLFEQVMIFSKTTHFILIIDEFQDIEKINPAFFSEMQNIWDSYKEQSKINLIVCGSVFFMMTKIFENNKEPLFGRATAKINLKPFSPETCKEILYDYNPKYTKEDLLCLYMLSGGVAKYIFLLMDSKSTTKKKMIKYVCNIASPFLTDGKESFVSELGKDYGVYFSILSLIARGMTTQSEIDSIIQKNTGAYLSNLVKTFEVIKPIRPIFSKPESRNVHWRITDNYIRFYFKFVYSNQRLIELNQLDLLQEIILRDYESFSGYALEDYFRAKIQTEQRITNIGSWWDKKSQNEIDIITINDVEMTCNIYEVKRNPKKINLSVLENEAEQIKVNVPNHKNNLFGLSMQDM